MFEWQEELDLLSERSERVRYCEILVDIDMLFLDI